MENTPGLGFDNVVEQAPAMFQGRRRERLPGFFLLSVRDDQPIHHGKMLLVQGDQNRLAFRRGGRDQGVGQSDLMAFAVISSVQSTRLGDLAIHAHEFETEMNLSRIERSAPSRTPA